MKKEISNKHINGEKEFRRMYQNKIPIFENIIPEKQKKRKHFLEPAPRISDIRLS